MESDWGISEVENYSFKLVGVDKPKSLNSDFQETVGAFLSFFFMLKIWSFLLFGVLNFYDASDQYINIHILLMLVNIKLWADSHLGGIEKSRNRERQRAM